eukprot:GHVS01016138.1.p1 GENE.GHVS01016138.1~~GHVS01016138.1.p1  ORF type:complete len:380 (+),score=68.96 GHVS01016138.1:65-1204(+)
MNLSLPIMFMLALVAFVLTIVPADCMLETEEDGNYREYEGVSELYSYATLGEDGNYREHFPAESFKDKMITARGYFVTALNNFKRNEQYEKVCKADMEIWTGLMKDALKNVKAVEQEISDAVANKPTDEQKQKNAEATIEAETKKIQAETKKIQRRIELLEKAEAMLNPLQAAIKAAKQEISPLQAAIKNAEATIEDAVANKQRTTELLEPLQAAIKAATQEIGDAVANKQRKIELLEAVTQEISVLEEAIKNAEATIEEGVANKQDAQAALRPLEEKIKAVEQEISDAVANKQEFKAINRATTVIERATRLIEYLKRDPEERKKNPLPIEHVFCPDMKRLQMPWAQIEQQEARFGSVTRQSSGGGAEPQAEDSVDDAN